MSTLAGRDPCRGSVLHVFPLDTTLLLGSTANQEISHALGCGPLVADLERRLARGEIAADWFVRTLLWVWQQVTTPLTEDVLEEVLAHAPWIPGLARVCADIHHRGEYAMVIAPATPDVFTERLRRPPWQVDIAIGAPFPPIPLASDDDASVPAPACEDVVGAVKRTYRHLAANAPELQVAAYASSARDVPLVRSLPGIPDRYGRSVSVAINAEEPRDDYDLRQLADVTYDAETPDLWTAYVRARRRLHQPELTAAAGALAAPAGGEGDG